MAVTQLYAQLVSEAHSSINSGYNQAIAHYTQQKNRFMETLNSAASMSVPLSARDFMAQLNREVISSTTSSSMTSKFNEIFEPVREIFKEEVSKKLMGQSASAKKLRQYIKDKKIVAQQKQWSAHEFYSKTIHAINAFLHASGYEREMMSFVGDNSDIQSQLYGYLRKMIFERLVTRRITIPSTQNFVNSLKGYYKEEAIIDALNKMFSSYPGLSAIGTGAQRNEKGQQIKYDIIIADSASVRSVSSGNQQVLNHLISSLNSMGGSYSVTGTATGITPNAFGVQSKSWIPPFKSAKAQKRNWSGFGGAGQYKPEGTEAYYWHAGVRNAMQNMIDIIGQGNVIYSTGADIYWTADLLTEFRNENYVLAFYRRKNANAPKIVSPNVGMMLHEDG